MNSKSMTTRSANVDNRRGRVCGAVALAVIAGLSAPAGAQIVASSHEEFSAVQGQNGWYYGFFDGDSATPWSLGDFEELPFFDTYWHRSVGPGGYWTTVAPDGGHPNGLTTSGERVAEDNWSVRRWVSDGQYVLSVFGRAWDANPPVPDRGDNGVIVYIMVDGSPIWQSIVEPGNGQGIEYDVQFCAVPGTIVDFAIDPRDSTDHGDETGFLSTIRTVIDHQPVDTFTCTGGTAELEVVTLPGTYTYQWRRNGDPVLHDGNMPRLRVVNVGSPVVGAYDCVITTECGSMISNSAMLTICDADFDCDGVLDSEDFFQYLTAFFNNVPRADLNLDGYINSQDYFDFLSMFFAGCS